MEFKVVHKIEDSKTISVQENKRHDAFLHLDKTAVPNNTLAIIEK